MNDQPTQPDPATQPADPPQAPPEDHPSQGLELECADHESRNRAVEQAVDYRGDVTLVTTAGDHIIGYVYDRVLKPSTEGSRLRLIPADGNPRITLPYAEVQRIIFSGRDPAAGKSWETWVTKYQEKKARGETATIEPEKLD